MHILLMILLSKYHLIMRGRSSWVDKPNFGLNQKTTAKSMVQRKQKLVLLRKDLTAQLTRTHRNVCVPQIIRKSKNNSPF
ncbi:hypothetical protein EMIT040CA3_30200 [Bacillus pseudomycoides]